MLFDSYKIRMEPKLLLPESRIQSAIDNCDFYRSECFSISSRNLDALASCKKIARLFPWIGRSDGEEDDEEEGGGGEQEFINLNKLRIFSCLKNEMTAQ